VVSNEATVTVDYPQTATASSEDNVTAVSGNEIVVDVLGNDSDPENDMDPTTVKIIDPTGTPVTELVVPNEGTWTVDPATGAITFTPEAGFIESPTPIKYVVNDTTGNTSTPVSVNITMKLDSDGDGIPDEIDLDDDNDGIPDTVEEKGNTDLDTDGDGVPDRLDLDSDNDGILDLLESGQDVAAVDTDGNGILDSVTDSDQDGLMDSADVDDNDKDSKGTVTPRDTDGDSKRDFQDVDSDNDSLSDMVEAGIPADKDADSDGMIDNPSVDENGVPTIVPSAKDPVNTDGDSVPDYRDLDSDNDGLNDVEEVDGLDENKDGIVDVEDSLVDGNALPEMDGDDIPDVLDVNNPDLPSSIDANGDGIIDDTTDTDHDGIPDVTDGKDNTFGTSPLNTESALTEDRAVVDLSQPVTINVLENDNAELNPSSLQIELPEGFMEAHPDAVLSADGKTLVVPNEGTWTVNSDGTITYEAEAGITPVDPTPISYSVETTDGKRLKTNTKIVLSQSVVDDATDTNSTEACEAYENNVSIYSNGVIFLVILLGSLFGGFLVRKENA